MNQENPWLDQLIPQKMPQIVLKHDQEITNSDEFWGKAKKSTYLLKCSTITKTYFAQRDVGVTNLAISKLH